VSGFVAFLRGWPGVRGGWPGVADLAAAAEAMVEVTREYPVCPDIPASAFLLALAEPAQAGAAPPTFSRSLPLAVAHAILVLSKRYSVFS
jgi:hypothetical protein